jgi:hypothetical protein
MRVLTGTAADLVADALATQITRLPELLRRSLTWDQGKEMAAHGRFSVETGLPVYLCDPRSPWQRGSNENTDWCRLGGPGFSDGTCSAGPLGDSCPASGNPAQVVA